LQPGFRPPMLGFMLRGRSRSLGEERGAVGRVVLLALSGLVIGAPLGFLAGAGAALVICHGAGSSGYGEGCGMAWLFLTFFGIPIGALIGAVVGIIAAVRRPKLVAAQGAGSADGIEREAPLAAWLAVAGGVAIAFGAWGGWRTVEVPYTQIGRLEGVLTSGPEPVAFIGGLLVFFGGVLRVLRPVAPAPSALVGVGAVLGIVGVAWGFTDFLQVPGDLTKHLFVGMWISCAGSVLAVAGFLTDRSAKDAWRRWRRVAPV
jgi:hypothetical protein